MAGAGHGGGMQALTSVFGQLQENKRADQQAKIQEARIQSSEDRQDQRLQFQEKQTNLRYALGMQAEDHKAQREENQITQLMSGVAAIKGRKFKQAVDAAEAAGFKTPQDREWFIQNQKDELTADMERLFEKNPKFGAIGLALTHEAIDAYGNSKKAGHVAVDENGDPIPDSMAAGSVPGDSLDRDMSAGLTKRNPELARSMDIMKRQKSEGKFAGPKGQDRQAQLQSIMDALQAHSESQDSMGTKAREMFDNAGEYGGKAVGFVSGLIGGGANDLPEDSTDTRAGSGYEEGIKKGILSGRNKRKDTSKAFMQFFKDFTGK